MLPKALVAKLRPPIHAALWGVRLLAPLLTRAALGFAFIGTGWGKWQNFDRTAQFFASLGIPAPTLNAAFIASLELVGGCLLLLGLGTRIIAALLSCTMIVALMTADHAKLVESLTPGTDTSPTDVTAAAFLMFLLWLVGYGAGWLSVDKLIASRCKACTE